MPFWGCLLDLDLTLAWPAQQEAQPRMTARRYLHSHPCQHLLWPRGKRQTSSPRSQAVSLEQELPSCGSVRLATGPREPAWRGCLS